jgi:hypothetical protein
MQMMSSLLLVHGCMCVCDETLRGTRCCVQQCFSYGFSRMFHSETTRERQSGSLVLWLAAWRHFKIYQKISGLVIVPVLWSCLIILLIFCSLQSLCLAQAVVLR